MTITIDKLGEMCYEQNRVISLELGEPDLGNWDNLSQEIKDSIINGIMNILKNPGISPEENHENWLKYKRAEGWAYGKEQDSENKISKYLLPWSELTDLQKQKDEIFINIINQFKDEIEYVVV